VVERHDPDLGAGLFLHAHIGGAVLPGADEHDRQAGALATAGDERIDFVLDFRADNFGNATPVNLFRVQCRGSGSGGSGGRS